MCGALWNMKHAGTYRGPARKGLCLDAISCVLCALCPLSRLAKHKCSMSTHSIAKMHPCLVSCRGWQELEKSASATADGSFIRCPQLRLVLMQATDLRRCNVLVSRASDKKCPGISYKNLTSYSCSSLQQSGLAYRVDSRP